MYAFLKTQYGMKVNKVRGLGRVAVYALYSVLCHVLTREAAENMGRPDKAVSPTFFDFEYPVFRKISSHSTIDPLSLTYRNPCRFLAQIDECHAFHVPYPKSKIVAFPGISVHFQILDFQKTLSQIIENPFLGSPRYFYFQIPFNSNMINRRSFKNL